MPRLEYVLWGIERHESRSGGDKWKCLPITPHILEKLWEVWAPQGHTQDTKLIWAAATLCSFAFLRAGELATPLPTCFDPEIYLCMADIAVDSLLSPLILQVTPKQSKTNPYHGRSHLVNWENGYEAVPCGCNVGLYC